MSNYYLLRRASDPKILGVNNGIKQADIKREGFKHPEKYDNLITSLGTNRYWEIRDTIGEMQFEVQCAEMLPNAKWTDFLLFGPHLIHCHFMISPKIVGIFNRFDIAAHRLIPATIINRSAKRDYYIFYMKPMPIEVIDFKNSVFYTGNEISGKKFHVFATEEERAACNERLGLSTEKIQLSSNISSGLDLFFLLTGELVVSLRLKNELEELSASSGVSLLPAFGQVRWPTIVAPA